MCRVIDLILIRRFVLSAGPQTTGEKGRLLLDYADPAVRGMLVLDHGANRFPAPVYEPPAPKAAPAAAAEEAVALEPEAPEAPFVKGATTAAAAAAALVGVGLASPDEATSALLGVFLLSSFAGKEVVYGVAPALHSPLMAVTNAVSGMTAVGGLALLGPGLTPSNPAEALGAAALALSAINIFGGFEVAAKMLDLFRRPDDPPEFYE